MNAHTPAPWETKPQGDANHYFTLRQHPTRGGKDWLMFIQFNGELSVAEQEANIRLIDGAPTLLDEAAKLVAKLKTMAVHERHYAELDAIVAKAGGQATYNAARIAWELERTAMGHCHFGNALRIAMDIPDLTADDRALLDRYAIGAQTGTDHVALQELAQRIDAMARKQTS